MNIIPVSTQQYSEAISLLQQASLPVKDIAANVQLFVLQEGEKPVGTIGYETDGTTGLLRSLAVSEDYRRMGHGERLVEFLENRAKREGLQSFYLLTTSAAPFFFKRGYVAIDRAEAPLFIQQSAEFKSLCPSSATVMKKSL